DVCNEGGLQPNTQVVDRVIGRRTSWQFLARDSPKCADRSNRNDQVSKEAADSEFGGNLEVSVVRFLFLDRIAVEVPHADTENRPFECKNESPLHNKLSLLGRTCLVLLAIEDRQQS